MTTYIEYYRQVYALHRADTGGGVNQAKLDAVKLLAEQALQYAQTSQDTANGANNAVTQLGSIVTDIGSRFDTFKAEMQDELVKINADLSKVKPEFIQITSDMLHIDNSYPYSKGKVRFKNRYTATPYVIPFLRFNSAIATNRYINVYDVDANGCAVRVNFKTIRPSVQSGETIDIFLMVIPSV